ncbi:MAG: response regulator transcription factor [Bryobacteraceae bacterium]|jgi:DNA-binding NarL/FixJ family response regulator
MRVVLVTDQPILGEGIRVVVERSASLEIQAICQHPADFLGQLPRLSAELVLLDVGPEISFQFLADVHSAAPGCRLVLLARTISPELTFHAQELGVSALLSTACTPQWLVACLERVAHGEQYFENTLPLGSTPARAVRLSRREGQLVSLLAQGLKNKEIAACLDITEGTVKVYLSKLFQKVGAKDRLELALFGLKNMLSEGDGLLGLSTDGIANAPPRRSPAGLGSLVLRAPAPVRRAG